MAKKTKGTQTNGRKLSRKSAASSHPTLSDLSVGKDIAKAIRQRFKARFGQTAIAAVSSAYYVLLELQETVVANLPKVLTWKLKTPELHLRKLGVHDLQEAIVQFIGKMWYFWDDTLNIQPHIQVI